MISSTNQEIPKKYFPELYIYIYKPLPGVAALRPVYFVQTQTFLHLTARYSLLYHQPTNYILLSSSLSLTVDRVSNLINFTQLMHTYTWFMYTFTEAHVFASMTQCGMRKRRNTEAQGLSLSLSLCVHDKSHTRVQVCAIYVIYTGRSTSSPMLQDHRSLVIPIEYWGLTGMLFNGVRRAKTSAAMAVRERSEMKRLLATTIQLT